MKRIIAAVAAICLILAGCSVTSDESVDDIIEDVGAPGGGDVGGNFHSDPIYGVFRNLETGEVDTRVIGQLNHYGDAVTEDYVQSLGWYTELNFAVEIYDDDLGTVVEWLPESTLFDSEAVTAMLYNEDGEKEAYLFEDNNALRWFMLDSLAATLRISSYGLHYTMDGGKDLVLEGLEPVDTFPADELYWSAHGLDA